MTKCLISGSEVKVDDDSRCIHCPVGTRGGVMLVRKVSFKFEMLRDWKSRTGDQLRPAHFVIPAVVIDLSAGVRTEPEAAD